MLYKSANINLNQPARKAGRRSATAQSQAEEYHIESENHPPVAQVSRFPRAQHRLLLLSVVHQDKVVPQALVLSKRYLVAQRPQGRRWSVGAYIKLLNRQKTECGITNASVHMVSYVTRFRRRYRIARCVECKFFSFEFLVVSEHPKI